MNYFVSTKTNIILQLLEKGSCKVVIIEGAPGTGKTALGRYFAYLKNAHLEYFLCHHWVTEEDLFYSVDIGRVVINNLSTPEEAYKPGVLLRALFHSQKEPCVIILDELDKAPERGENLLLDFLQTGEIRGAYGQVWKANLSNLYIFITSNGIRPLGDPLLRRAFRISLDYLPPEVERDLLRKETGASPGLIKLVVNLANILRQNEVSVSLYEMRNFLLNVGLCKDPQEVKILFSGFFFKKPEDEFILSQKVGNNWESIIWGVMKDNENNK